MNSSSLLPSCGQLVQQNEHWGLLSRSFVIVIAEEAENIQCLSRAMILASVNEGNPDTPIMVCYINI